ncbi:MAG: CPBP family intramembrane glutamic endopeptidase [Polyangiaceae bacterium]|nr:CPBP family intramembrane glutamic endopeptidase [Polyangiaceae bacterium]
MKYVLLTCATVTLAVAVAFQPSFAGSWLFWAPLLGAYAVLSALAIRHMLRAGTLAKKLVPRGGDLALGALIGGLLLLGTWFGRSHLAPMGAPQAAWLLRLYLQVGSPDALQRSVSLTALLLLLPLLEELVWRGLVLDELVKKLGRRRAWPLAALLYGLCHLPTVYLLRDNIAGPNPLVLFAALGAGLVWSFGANQLGRLTPIIVSHMAFTYFSAVQFRLPGM